MPSLTLAALIREHQAATGESYADIAKRSGLSRAKVGQLGLEPPRANPPRAETLARLAEGLRLPMHLVQRAYMTTYGLTAPDDDAADISLLVERFRALPRDAQEIVTALVGVLTEREHRRG